MLSSVLFSLIIARDTSCKSVKKNTKKQSITKGKSHYLLLMGRPVEDGHHRKGLGMIFASQHSGDFDTSKAESKHSDPAPSSSNSDLSNTLQTSSNGSTSDRGYSYTEALFTGTPLLNGRPFTASDRTYSQGHATDHPIGILNANERITENVQGKAVDEDNDDSRADKNDQTQEEMHTDEGVKGVTVNKILNKGQYSGEKSEDISEDSSLRQSSKLGKENYEDGHPLPPHSLDKQDKLETNRQAYRGRKLINNIIKSDNLADEDVHEIMATGHTQENFDKENVGSSGQLREENKANKVIPLNTKVKSYDEESNLLGSNTLTRERFMHQQRDNPLGDQQEGFNQNIISLTENEKGPQGVKQQQEEIQQPQHMIIITEDSGMKQKVQKEDSSGKTSDAKPHAMGSYLKETSPVSTGNTGGVHESNKGSETIPPTNESPDGHSDYSHSASGQLAGEQMRQQTSDIDVNAPAEALRNQETGKLNDSPTGSSQKATTSTSDKIFQNFLSHLRPHKVIESAFDERLAQRIPSEQHDPHEAHTRPTNEKPSSSVLYPGLDASHLSSTYREGSSPSYFKTQSQEPTKEIPSIQESPSSTDTTSVYLTGNNLKGPTVQQEKAKLPTGAVGARLNQQNAPLVNNPDGNNEQGNVDKIKESAEQTEKPYSSADENSTEPQRYSSSREQGFLNVLLSHYRQSNTANSSTANNLRAEDHGEHLVPSWSVRPESGQLGPLSGSDKEGATQEKNSYKENQVANDLQNNAKYASQQSQGPNKSVEDRNQREHNQEIPPTLDHRKGNSLDEHGFQLSGLSGHILMEKDAQSGSSFDLTPSHGFGARPVNGETNSQQVSENSAKEEGANDSWNFFKLTPKSGSQEFAVGNPEHPGEVSVKQEPKVGNNNQKQPEGNMDHDNSNQKIVYFLKMAKGIPLLHNRPENDEEDNHNQVNSDSIKERERADSAGNIRPYSSPSPNSGLSPTAGREEGAIGESNVPINVRQGRYKSDPQAKYTESYFHSWYWKSNIPGLALAKIYDQTYKQCLNSEILVLEIL